MCYRRLSLSKPKEPSNGDFDKLSHREVKAKHRHPEAELVEAEEPRNRKKN